jgi:hypothetical protein
LPESTKNEDAPRTRFPGSRECSRPEKQSKYILWVIIRKRHFFHVKIPALFTPENRAPRLYAQGTNILCEDSAQFYPFFKGGFS